MISVFARVRRRRCDAAAAGGVGAEPALRRRGRVPAAHGPHVTVRTAPRPTAPDPAPGQGSMLRLLTGIVLLVSALGRRRLRVRDAGPCPRRRRLWHPCDARRARHPRRRWRGPGRRRSPRSSGTSPSATSVDRDATCRTARQRASQQVRNPEGAARPRQRIERVDDNRTESTVQRRPGLSRSERAKRGEGRAPRTAASHRRKRGAPRARPSAPGARSCTQSRRGASARNANWMRSWPPSPPATGNRMAANWAAGAAGERELQPSAGVPPQHARREDAGRPIAGFGAPGRGRNGVRAVAGAGATRAASACRCASRSPT